MNKCGIYAIVNMKNGRRYVGQSVRMHTRIQNHLFSLMENSHPNKHLQSAFNLYGAECFTGEIIEYCSRDELQNKEQLWIDHYGFDNLYNLAPSSKSTAGVKYGDDVRKNMSKAHKGKKTKQRSQETKEKIALAAKSVWSNRSDFDRSLILRKAWETRKRGR